MRAARPGLWLAVGGLVVLAAMAAMPGLFTGADPDAADLSGTFAPPGAGHWLGTDENGRDLWARIVYGARPSLLIGAGSVLLALAAGTAIGVGSAQLGRWADQVLGRALEVLLSVPWLLLVFLVVAAMGPGTFPAMVGLALVCLPGFARVVRAEVLRLRAAPFVEAAHGFGWSRARVTLQHVVPNALGPVLALATVSLGAMIVAGSSLGFVGLGPQPPTAEWGAMLATSRRTLSVAWWPAAFPGIALTLSVLAVTAVGQELQRRVSGRRP
ncbi:peptide/nickel transport system permease protein [Actinocorallia herbida]|uniref:Peptide/nickel transport system permease protein n=1 Tax=Actinocorallia herbida TaxID=58109 RepID=A0A3N1CWJ4_9ACTN|nr:ABC transporter permease [Actinocorallia herbida]ROO85595.1 peptide/nickel transport system permease protein [Actinocorallia herbida]